MRKLLIIISLLSLTSNPLYAKGISPEKTQLYKKKLDYIKYGIGLSIGTLDTDVQDANDGIKRFFKKSPGKPRYVITPFDIPLEEMPALPRIVKKIIPISLTSSGYDGIFLFVEWLLPNYLFGLRIQASLNKLILNNQDYQSTITYFNFTDVQIRWYFGNDKNWVLYGALRFLSFLKSYDYHLEKVEEELKKFIPSSYFGLEREGSSGFAMGIALFGNTNSSIRVLSEEEEEKTPGLYYSASYSEIYMSYNFAKLTYSLDPPGKWGYLVPKSSRRVDTFDDYMKFGFHLGPSYSLMNYQKIDYIYNGNDLGDEITIFAEGRFAKKYLGVRLGSSFLYSMISNTVGTDRDFIDSQRYEGIKPDEDSKADEIYKSPHMMQVRGELSFRLYPDQYSDLCLYIGSYLGYLINKKAAMVASDDVSDLEAEESVEILSNYPTPLIDLKKWNFGILGGADYEFKNGFILGYRISIAPGNIMDCEGERSKDHYAHHNMYLGYNFSKLIDLYGI